MDFYAELCKNDSAQMDVAADNKLLRSIHPTLQQIANKELCKVAIQQGSSWRVYHKNQAAIQ